MISTTMKMRVTKQSLVPIQDDPNLGLFSILFYLFYLFFSSFSCFSSMVFFMEIWQSRPAWRRWFV